MASKRDWLTKGSNKVSSLNVANNNATNVGTEYPQAGDLLYVVASMDNLNATTPQFNGAPIITGGGSTSAWTLMQRKTGMSASGAASAQLLVAWCRLTSNLTATSVITVNVNATVVAKSMAAFAFYNCGDPINETQPQASATGWYNAGQASDSISLTVAGASNNSTLTSTGTRLVTVATSGGSAATNNQVAVLVDVNGFSNSFSATNVDSIYAATIPAPPVVANPFPYADAFVWDGAAMIAGDLFQWDGATLIPLDVHSIV